MQVVSPVEAARRDGWGMGEEALPGRVATGATKLLSRYKRVATLTATGCRKALTALIAELHAGANRCPALRAGRRGPRRSGGPGASDRPNLFYQQCRTAVARQDQPQGRTDASEHEDPVVNDPAGLAEERTNQQQEHPVADDDDDQGDQRFNDLPRKREPLSILGNLGGCRAPEEPQEQDGTPIAQESDHVGRRQPR